MESIENKTVTSTCVKAIQLSELNLNDPVVTKETDRRRRKSPYIFKRLKDKMIEVACKPVKIPDQETFEYQKLQARLFI